MRIVLSMMVLGMVVMSGSAYAQGAAERGAKLFAESKCSMCHSIAGKGNPKGPLDGVAAKYKADELHQWIVDAPSMAAKTKATRKPAMKAYAQLSKEDVDALVAYLQTLKGK